MSNKIYIKRSFKEKLPETSRTLEAVWDDGDGDVEAHTCQYSKEKGFYHWNDEYNCKSITHWLEELPLEEYLKEIGYLVL